MITDCQILGIPDTTELTVIKEAYRKRAKELHPDSTANSKSIQNHFLFIEVCKAYQRLIKRSSVKKPSNKSNIINNVNEVSNTDIVQHKDQAYIVYKEGMNLFKKIHPSSWNLSLNSLSPNKSSDIEEQQTKERLASVIQLFPKSYYYFSIVINEFPSSVWAEDARKKMEIIEKRSKRYRKILESFKE